VGIATSFLLLARLMSYLLKEQRMFTFAFFFGLILMSVYFVARRVRRWNVADVVGLVVACAGGFLVTSLSPAQTPTDLWFIFICGAVAICAMILPGISGSFILLLLSKYEYMMNAIKSLDIVTIAVFAVGAVLGLISFSNVLAWLFKKFHDITIAVLAGFMLGSLNAIYPWKNVLGNNVLPTDVPFVSGEALWLSGGLIVLGLVVVAVLELVSAKK
jgi:putative membrane protein